MMMLFCGNHSKSCAMNCNNAFVLFKEKGKARPLILLKPPSASESVTTTRKCSKCMLLLKTNQRVTTSLNRCVAI